MCAVDQKRSFFPRVGPFLDLLPFKAPYGEASYEKAPHELQESLREGTGRDFTRIGREFPLVRRRPKKGRGFFTGSPLRGGTVLTGRAGVPYGSFTEKDDEEAYGKAGPLREAPYEEGRSLREGPLRADRLTGRPLTGRLLTRRPLTNYRKAYRKLRGGTLPELGGNFRLCAVDQKRPFFPRVGPFLDLLPVKGPFPLTGALTGRPP